MLIAEMTRDQLIALVRQQATALDACQREADVRAQCNAKDTVTSMEAMSLLPSVEATAAKLRKDALGKGLR